ncbi:MAG: amidohydrolase family protein, partial [Solirubrobacteraceae bacterium]
VPWVKRRPSEYVREHFRFTTAPAHLPSDPAALDQLLEMMDAPGMLVYASDYPHVHGDGPAALLDRLGEEERERVLWDTASTLYELRTPPAHQSGDRAEASHEPADC